MGDDGGFKAMSITLMIVIAILATLLNSLCLIIIGKSRALSKRPSTLLILNLLVVHWIQGALVFPFYAAKKFKVISLYWASIICDGFRLTYMVTFYAAIMAVLLISIDRLLATCIVLRYRQLVTRKKVLITIACAWLYVIVLCLLPFQKEDEEMLKFTQPLLSNNVSYLTTTMNTSLTANNITTEKVTNFPKINICRYNQSNLWTILMLTLNCAVPYIAITIIYQQIMSHVNVIQTRTKRSRTISSISDGTPQLKSEKLKREKDFSLKDKEQKQYEAMTRIAIIMCISYFIFWLPSVIYFLVLKLCYKNCFAEGYHDSSAEEYVSFFTKYLAYLDAIASPVIYCVLSEEFRKHLTFYSEKFDTFVSKSKL